MLLCFHKLDQSNCRNPAILYLRTEFRNFNSSSTDMKLLTAFFFLLFAVCTTAHSQTAAEFNPSKYLSGIKEDRKLKDVEMRTDEHSPIPSDEKAAFRKLNYYRPKIAYRKEASIERFDEAKRFLMKTTTERLPEYSLYGMVRFRHNGKTYALNVYQNIELTRKPGFQKSLFIPFNDETNGKATYGGGRFLDITEPGADTLILDFNLAYNPYCAYNHKYSCPIPPKENNLKIKVRAGEKKWHK